MSAFDRSGERQCCRTAARKCGRLGWTSDLRDVSRFSLQRLHSCNSSPWKPQRSVELSTLFLLWLCCWRCCRRWAGDGGGGAGAGLALLGLLVLLAVLLQPASKPVQVPAQVLVVLLATVRCYFVLVW